MSARDKSYKSSLIQDLGDPDEAAAFIEAALEMDDAAVSVALLQVVEARGGADVSLQAELGKQAPIGLQIEEGVITVAALQRASRLAGLPLGVRPSGRCPIMLGQTTRFRAYHSAYLRRGAAPAREAGVSAARAADAKKVPKLITSASLTKLRFFTGFILSEVRGSPQGDSGSVGQPRRDIGGREPELEKDRTACRMLGSQAALTL